MEKLDFKKKYKDLYAPSAKQVSLVTVPQLKFLMIDGKGDPNGSEFQSAVEALYSLSYTIKFWPKKHAAPQGFVEFSVSALEGLWWVEGEDKAEMNMNAPRDTWRWTAMILQPDFVTDSYFQKVRIEAEAKKQNPSLSQVRLETFEEGLSVQIMHFGPYSEELPNILKIAEYMKSNNYVSNGKHHEIYLSDPRRTAPENLKTILRHPVKSL